MSHYHENGTCHECGALLETEYEMDASLCSSCLQDEETSDPYEHEEEDALGYCPDCQEYDCVCGDPALMYDGSDEGQPKDLWDAYNASSDEKDLPF